MHKGLMADPESSHYKTRAFITQGRLHFLMFKINNLSIMRKRVLFIQRLERGYRARIQPLEAFEQGITLLCNFLEDGSSFLDFQELKQSRYTSKDASMEPTIIRCFRDIIAVIYKISTIKTVIVYQIYEEEYGGEVQANLEETEVLPLPEYHTGSGTDENRRKRFRLRQLLEVDNGVLADSTLHDMFFLDRDTLCLMVDSDMVIFKILGVERDGYLYASQAKGEYFKVKIKGNDDPRLTVRKFELDRMNECLYYLHGKTISKFEGLSTMLMRYADKMTVAGRIDLRGLKERLSELESDMLSIDGDGNDEKPSFELGESLINAQPSSIELNTSNDSD